MFCPGRPVFSLHVNENKWFKHWTAKRLALCRHHFIETVFWTCPVEQLQLIVFLCNVYGKCEAISSFVTELQEKFKTCICFVTVCTFT